MRKKYYLNRKKLLKRRIKTTKKRINIRKSKHDKYVVFLIVNKNRVNALMRLNNEWIEGK